MVSHSPAPAGIIGRLWGIFSSYVAFANAIVNRKQQVYAVIRIDRGAPSSEPKDTTTVTKIVSSLDVAKAEVERLNKLNAAKGATYFWQTTRMILDDDDHGAT